MKNIILIILSCLLIPTFAAAQEKTTSLQCARNVLIYFDTSGSMFKNDVMLGMLRRLEAVLEDKDFIRDNDQVYLYSFVERQAPMRFIADGTLIAGDSRETAIQDVRNVIAEVETSGTIAKLPKNMGRDNVFSNVIKNITTEIDTIGGISSYENIVIVFSDFIYDKDYDNAVKIINRPQDPTSLQSKNNQESIELKHSLKAFSSALNAKNYRFVMVTLEPGPKYEPIKQYVVDTTDIFKKNIPSKRLSIMDPGATVNTFVDDLVEQTRGRPTIPERSVKLYKNEKGGISLKFKIRNDSCDEIRIEQLSLPSIKNKSEQMLYPGGTYKMETYLAPFQEAQKSILLVETDKVKEIMEGNPLGGIYSVSLNLRGGGKYLFSGQTYNIPLSPTIFDSTVGIDIDKAVLTRHIDCSFLKMLSIYDVLKFEVVINSSSNKPLRIKIDEASLQGISLPLVGKNRILRTEVGEKSKYTLKYKLDTSDANLETIHNAIIDQNLELSLKWKAEVPENVYLPKSEGKITISSPAIQDSDFSTEELATIGIIFLIGLILRQAIKYMFKKQ